ncbi:MAG: hypothetical protein IJ542_02595 [Clostridia bacterium]|nr:hypothetical protein [Clostridia bacterium]
MAKKNKAKGKVVAGVAIAAVAVAGAGVAAYAIPKGYADPNTGKTTQQEQPANQEQTEDALVLRTQLNKALEDLETAEANIETLTSEKTALESKLSTANSEKTTLQGQLEEKTTQLATANQTVETLTGQKQTLETQLAAANENVETLTTQKTNLESQLATATSDNAELQEELDGVNEQLTAAQGTVATLTEQKTGLETQLAAANQTVETLTSEKTTLESQLATANASIETLTSQKESLESQLATANASIETLQGQIADLQTQVAELQEQLENQGSSERDDTALINLLNDLGQQKYAISENEKIIAVWSQEINGLNVYYTNTATKRCVKYESANRIMAAGQVGDTVFLTGQSEENVDLNNWTGTNLFKVVVSNGEMSLVEKTINNATEYSIGGVDGETCVVADGTSYAYDSVNDTFAEFIQPHMIGLPKINNEITANEEFSFADEVYSPFMTVQQFMNKMSTLYHSEVNISDYVELRVYNLSLDGVRDNIANLDTLNYVIVNSLSDKLIDYMQSGDTCFVFVYEQSETIEFEARTIDMENGYELQYNYITNSNTGSAGDVQPGLRYVNKADPEDVTEITPYGYGFYRRDLGNGKILISSAITQADANGVNYTDTGLILFDTNTKRSSVLIDDGSKYPITSEGYFAESHNGQLLWFIPYNYNYSTGEFLNKKGLVQYDTQNNRVIQTYNTMSFKNFYNFMDKTLLVPCAEIETDSNFDDNYYRIYEIANDGPSNFFKLQVGDTIEDMYSDVIKIRRNGEDKYYVYADGALTLSENLVEKTITYGKDPTTFIIPAESQETIGEFIERVARQLGTFTNIYDEDTGTLLVDTNDANYDSSASALEVLTATNLRIEYVEAEKDKDKE